MTTPELEPLDADILTLLDGAKPIAEVAPERKAAIFGAITARIEALPPPDGGGDGGSGGAEGGPGTATGGGIGGAGAPGNTGAGVTGVGATKAAVALAVTFALGVGTGVAVDRSVPGASQESAPAALAPPSIPAAPSAEPSARGVPVEALPPASAVAVRPSARAVEPPQEPHVASARGLAAERSLLDVARAALARGEASEALAAVDRHAQAYPEGVLAEEREILAVKALVGLGRREEATRRAAAFERKYPKSLGLRAVKAAVESLP